MEFATGELERDLDLEGDRDRLLVSAGVETRVSRHRADKCGLLIVVMMTIDIGLTLKL